MTRLALLTTLAPVVLLATLGAMPASAADGSAPQVVEAGSALFPSRAYILTLTDPVKLRVDDRTTSTSPRTASRVKDLSVLSSASGRASARCC